MKSVEPTITIMQRYNGLFSFWLEIPRNHKSSLLRLYWLSKLQHRQQTTITSTIIIVFMYIWGLLCITVCQVKWRILQSYVESLGIFLTVMLILSYALFQVSSVLSNIWLSHWTEDALLQNATLTNTTIYMDRRDFYLFVYGGLGVLQGDRIVPNCLNYVYLT